MGEVISQQARRALADAYRAEGLGNIADWIVTHQPDNSTHRPALLALTTAQAEIEALREEVERNDAIIRSLQNELQAHKDALAQWESGWRNWREADD